QKRRDDAPLRGAGQRMSKIASTFATLSPPLRLTARAHLEYTFFRKTRGSSDGRAAIILATSPFGKQRRRRWHGGAGAGGDRTIMPVNWIDFMVAAPHRCTWLRGSNKEFPRRHRQSARLCPSSSSFAPPGVHAGFNPDMTVNV